GSIAAPSCQTLFIRTFETVWAIAALLITQTMPLTAVTIDGGTAASWHRLLAGRGEVKTRTKAATYSVWAWILSPGSASHGYLPQPEACRSISSSRQLRQRLMERALEYRTTAGGMERAITMWLRRNTTRLRETLNPE